MKTHLKTEFVSPRGEFHDFDHFSNEDNLMAEDVGAKLDNAAFGYFGVTSTDTSGTCSMVSACQELPHTGDEDICMSHSKPIY